MNKSIMEKNIVKGDIPIFASIYRDVSEDEIQFLATHYDFIFILDTFCKKPLLDRIRHYNNNVKILMLTNPYFFQSYYGVFKEEWKARSKKGDYIYSTYGDSAKYKIHLLDYANRKWQQAFSIKNADRIKNSGADGILIDTLTNSAPYPIWASGLHKNYSVKNWKSANRNLLNVMTQQLAKSGRDLLIYNGLISEEKIELQNREYLDFSNGAAIETYGLGQFDLDSGDMYRYWFFHHSIMKLMKHAVDKDKYVFLEIRADSKSKASQLFALSSFLLLRSDKTFFYAASKKNDETLIWFPEWQLKLGKPVKPYSEKNGIFRREYQNGIIVVNSTSDKKRVNLEGHFYNLENEKVTHIDVKSLYGTILLKHANINSDPEN
ncbi:MAG: hypothetical protein GY699_19270 [Desulfobacteraceae bacterium]|nr:hypothetical protein [Desulfobacteraceae bacterium]